MENKAHALAAGLFTLLLGAAVVAAAMWFSGDTYEKAYYVLESKYAVTGLNEQAVVRYRGVDIGKVTRIRFDPSDSRVILIDVAIDSSMQLTRATFAELRYQGVTGLSYVMLDDTGKSAERLPPATEEGSTRIPIRESLFSNLADVTQQVLSDAREVMKRMNTLLSDDNQLQLSRALSSIETATRELAVLAKAIEPAARNSDALVADARKAFQQADKLLIEIAATNRDLANRLQAFDRVAGSAEKAGGAITALADNVTTETLPRINALAEELARTSRSLDRLANSIKEQPQSVVFGRRSGPPGPGETGFDGKGAAK
ncbi:MAG TPA: MlaD family protein [Burkholderiales bacterium]|nr:MlaD family protein [Burkholderiales bacterium]